MRIVTRFLAILLLLGLTVPGVAGEAGRKVYSDSFKKGATRVTEQAFDVTLTPEKPRQDFKILDSTGKARYVLRFVPDISRGDTKIVGWFVRLADLRHKIYESVLTTSPDPTRDTTLVWWLDGRQFARIPLQAARIFKVEQFYCVVEVKTVKRLGIGQPYLQQLDLSVQFTNTRPQP